jgi:hypothetical protein
VAEAAANAFTGLQDHFTLAKAQITYEGHPAAVAKTQPSNKLLLFIIALVGFYFFVFRKWLLDHR